MRRGCTQCGECLNVCPVFQLHRREEYSPKGKRILMEPLIGDGPGSTPQFSWEDVFALARLCAGCGRCKKACVRKLSAADLLADVRSAHPHWSQHLWELWIRHLGPIWPTIGFLASLAPHGLTPKMLETSICTAKALIEKKNILPWIRLQRGTQTKIDPSPVVLFSGCTANNVRNTWTNKAELLLEVFGYTVKNTDGFTCCGGTMHHAGQYRAMNEMCRQNIEVWRQLGRPRMAVFCASCCHRLAKYADCALSGEEATQWGSGLIPLSALLTGATGESTGEMPTQIGYHQPCHWDRDNDLPFLSGLMPGLQQGGGLCCGMGGVLKMTDPDVSLDMAKNCLTGFSQNVSVILTGCSGCALQLAAAAQGSVSVYHWLDVVSA